MTHFSQDRPALQFSDRHVSSRDRPRRLFCGVHISSGATSVDAALIAIHGSGVDADIETLASNSQPIATELTRQIQDLQEITQTPSAFASVSGALAEHQTNAIESTLRSADVSPPSILAVGVHDPGIWNLTSHSATARAGLCDSARLAESTGLNVVDAFAERDLAAGGQGGPIWPLAEWIVLHDPLRTRVLVDLGRSVTLTFLPPGREGPKRLLSFQVGPGSGLLDLLTCQLTSGAKRYDPGGSLAVQGKRIPELLDHWLDDPYFKRPIPRWHPWGVRPERFFTESVQMAVATGWSVRDLLCTATHFIALSIDRALTRLPQAEQIDEVVVCGGGQQNGLLLGELSRLLGNRPLLRMADLAMPGDTLRPVSLAVMAMMYVDRVAANSATLTGASRPAVLGRLTPGSDKNWYRLVREMARLDQRGEAYRRAI